MPVIEDYLAKLGRGRLWSKLDIEEAFLQVELDEASRDANTFITVRGLFRFKRLPFGLVTAPELFQKTMDEILSGCEGAHWYLDDVIVEGQDLNEHDKRFNKVLSRLNDRGVELNWDKCQLRVTELDFLGHKIAQDEIRPSKVKTHAILSFREPSNEAEVRSFLGLANYMNRYIPKLSSIDEPLRKLLHKDSKFEWNVEQTQSFQVIKEAMADVKCLEKEALALVWAVERFQYYLLGKSFDLFTDCKTLGFLFSVRTKPCARIERWVLRLQAFDYKVVFISGKNNVADPLSRLSVLSPIPFDSNEEIFVREVAMHAVSSSALQWNEIREASRNDREIQEILGLLLDGNTQNLPVAYRVLVNELCELQGVLLRGDRIVVPESLRKQVLQTAHEGPPGITMMKNHLRSNVWWPKIDVEVEKLVKNCRGCTLVAAPEAPEPMQRSQLPKFPWHTVAIDFLGPLPEGQSLLVVIDCYSRFMEICEMDKTTAGDVIKELSVMFSRYGIPALLKADNAPQFSSECIEFKKFCDSHGVKLSNTIPYWPLTNGEVERQNRSILRSCLGVASRVSYQQSRLFKKRRK
ncbi:uncharacterized protein K02A2.6-like [Toxorhynchites rutilus septentrionalis]|uniref:uncharacterized protein K02A2.6-like n=1 Tax=Toxorhynchites rutilus septentrionalis TaxID=329112 RepID=UPI002479CE11|nr:uncharacterized protein K02A2.6-like [Toxorhynchites rutilus septentrionalis]